MSSASICSRSPGTRCNDAAASLHLSYAVLDDDGTQRDTGIEIAHEIEIEDSAGINSSLCEMGSEVARRGRKRH